MKNILIIIVLLFLSVKSFGKTDCCDIKKITLEKSIIPIQIEIEINNFFFYYILDRCDKNNLMIDEKIEKELNYLSDRIYVLQIKQLLKYNIDDLFKSLPIKLRFK